VKRTSRVLVVSAFALIVGLTEAGFAADRPGVASLYGSGRGASVAQLGLSASPVDPALAQALRFAPVGRSAQYEIDFTDWAAIESRGSFRLSANPTTAQLAAFFSRVSDAGVQSFEPITTLFPFPALRWEATFFLGDAPTQCRWLPAGVRAKPHLRPAQIVRLYVEQRFDLRHLRGLSLTGVEVPRLDGHRLRLRVGVRS
jgi:hypothetical protein